MVSNLYIVTSFWYKQGVQVGQKVGRNVIGPLKSGIGTNMEDYGDIMSDMELVAKVSILSISTDHPPPSSAQTPEQQQQEVLEEDEGEGENVNLGLRQNMFEPSAPAHIHGVG